MWVIAQLEQIVKFKAYLFRIVAMLLNTGPTLSDQVARPCCLYTDLNTMGFSPPNVMCSATWVSDNVTW